VERVWASVTPRRGRYGDYCSTGQVPVYLTVVARGVERMGITKLPPDDEGPLRLRIS